MCNTVWVLSVDSYGYEPEVYRSLEKAKAQLIEYYEREVPTLKRTEQDYHDGLTWGWIEDFGGILEAQFNEEED